MVVDPQALCTPPPWLRPLLASQVSGLARLPNPQALLTTAAQAWQLSEQQLGLAPSREALWRAVLQAWQVCTVCVALPCEPSLQLVCAQLPLVTIATTSPKDLAHAALDQACDMCCVSLGAQVSLSAVLEQAQAHAQLRWLVDDTWWALHPDQPLPEVLPDHVVIVRSLCHYLACPGLPLAVALGSAPAVKNLGTVFFPESFNSLALRVAQEGLRDVDYRRELAVLAQGQPTKTRPSRPKRTPALMVQGTSSGAGKSLLTAALCRIVYQDGLRVCPFKAQNMANNSAVTLDGLEIGRAQALQARAARQELDVRMNPVLLKPHSETGSQIILMGKPYAQAEAKPYMQAVRATLQQTVHAAYDSLSQEYDLMLLEGAGSPGEVNLKRGDLVNMSMARHAQARVLLVGDIDRGGLYASFVGHLEVFEEWERDLVAGFVVNRFRGDASLLDDAHQYVQRYTGKPVLGVIPYCYDLGLPEEDGVELSQWQRAKPQADLDIAVLQLHYPSNISDFDPLRLEGEVQLRLVKTLEQLGQPDAVIIPGSKHTALDLASVRERGLDRALLALAQQGCEIVGICGGLQMLGQELCDPLEVESVIARQAGLGLLPLTTTWQVEKTVQRVVATHLPSGLAVRGYEIHQGQSKMDDAAVLFRALDGRPLGCRATQLPVWGSYLHGQFDDDVFRRWWLNSLRQRKGLPAIGKVSAVYDIDVALDRLATVVRQSLDISALYRLAGLA